MRRFRGPVVAQTLKTPNTPLGYLDTCLVIGLAKEDLRPNEQRGLEELSLIWDEGRLDLVTSSVTKEEIHFIPEAVRVRHEATVARLATVPTWQEVVLPIVTNRPGPRQVGPVQHGDLTELRRLLRDEADARHLFQAIKSGAGFFITDDQRSIVSRADEIESRYAIRVRLPSVLVAELTG
jgi:hypothetical protein